MLKSEGPPLLIIDHDPNFLESLQVEAAAQLRNPVLAVTAAAARAALRDGSRGFSGIFVNPTADSLQVLRTIIERHTGTPLYFICDLNIPSPVPIEDLGRITVHGAFQKPLTFAQMCEIASPVADSFELDADVARAINTPEPEGTELSPEGVEFVAIRAANYLAGKRSFFDLYVKAGPGRFFKIVKSGESFDPQRLVSYIKKGVSWVYLRKEARQAYLKYCDHVANGLIASQQAPATLKAVQTMNFGEEALKFLREQGVEEATLQHAYGFVDTVCELMRERDWGSDPIISKFLGDVIMFEHGVSTAIIVAMLFKPLQIESERLQRMIGLAALLHDIGLYCLPEYLQTKDEKNMTYEEMQLYAGHPRMGAELLREHAAVDHVILQAIHQHHERRDGSGFPCGHGPGMITRVAELIGIADEFVRLLLLARLDTNIKVFEVMKMQVFDGFSAEVVNAFYAALMPHDASELDRKE